MPLILALACQPMAPEPADSEPSADSGSRRWTVDTDAHVEVVDDAPRQPKECADLYDPDQITHIELDFEPAQWTALNQACVDRSQAYHPVQFTVDGERTDAMVRLKGNWSWSCDKLQFVVSFNEVDPDARFHGLRKVMLDAPWYDHTLLHERLAFPLFQARGLPYSCANSARVDVNGSYYGLYTNVERIDREYLERHFDDPDGNLYQGGTELKTNEDVGDVSRQRALAAATTVGQIEALMDLDQAVAEWAMEALIPAMDNYWAGVEINYYLYDHPTRGFLMLPYDLDISFGDAAYSDGTLIWPDAVRADPIHYEHPGWRKEALVETVLDDPAWCARFVQELEAARSVYVPDDLIDQIDAWDDQIRPSLEADPHKTFSDARHDQAIADLRRFVVDRAAFVDDWLAQGGHCPD